MNNSFLNEIFARGQQEYQRPSLDELVTIECEMRLLHSVWTVEERTFWPIGRRRFAP
jgi:hypothetical protein